jgi:FxsC-like protein
VTYFFLSYARGHDDAYVEQFFDDLSQEIRRRTGIPPNEPVGFLDTRNLALGTRWPEELTAALAICQVFVAIYSPRYFARANCGKEWAVFAARMRAYEEATGRHPDLLLPVLWVPQPAVPAVAGDIQFLDSDLGQTYLDRGLYRMLRIRRFEDEYQEFLARLGDKMLQLTDQHVLPPAAPVDLEAVPNPFPPDWGPRTGPGRDRTGDAPPPARSRPTTGGGEWRPPAGGGHVEFVFVVSTADEQPAGRQHREFYGETAADWRPYLPDDQAPLSLTAQRTAVSRDFTSNVTTAADGTLIDRLDRARENNQIVVLLVDVWATRIAKYRQMLVRYDRRNEPTTGVMVPWNDNDDEIRAAEDELRNDLSDTFPENIVRRDPLFRHELRTPAAFVAILREVLTEAQNRVFARGAVRRRAEAGAPVERPILHAR